MSSAYFEAMRDGLVEVLNLLRQLALPAAVFFGLVVIGLAFKGSSLSVDWASLRKSTARSLAYIGVGLIVVCLWSGLKRIQPIAKADIEWKESAQATNDPAPDAPSIDQYGPVVASMVEKTYQRTLTLPPDFFMRLGAEGVGVLSPYLVDPTTENVLELVDTFRRSGQDVVFTREVTREDEEPMSFDSSDINVAFHRLQDQAYDMEFDATFTFTNSTSESIKSRFLFSLPQYAGTVQDLSVSVGGQDVSEPDERGYYAWTGQIGPGEKREAKVHYKSVGSRYWSYDLGSSRRRVKVFNLTATVDGPVQFEKGSIEPTSRTDGTIVWKLPNVITSQQLALTFPRDVVSRDGYLQALATLPATLVLFVLGVLAIAARLGMALKPTQLALCVLAFGLGLGAIAVLSNYVGPMLAVFIGPLAGAAVASAVLGRQFLIAALPVALIPATSLSPQNTGMWVLVLATVGLVGFLVSPRLGSKKMSAEV